MALKEDKNIELSNQLAHLITDRLSSVDGISTKKMFGGSGIMYVGKMIGLIDSKGNCFIKAEDQIKEKLITQGGERHSRMPYYSISEDVINDSDQLLPLVEHAISITK